MKSKMTKLVSLLIIFSMCISLCAVSTVSGAEASETVEADTQTVLAAKYEEEINVLSYLGIIDSDVDLVNAITRAEFAEMALAIGNIPVGTYEYTRFYDVTPGTAQCNAVMTAAESGIVNGGDSSMFFPDQNITVGQAVTMIMRAIGYEDMALLRYNGSSDACVQYARSVKLLKTGTTELLKGSDAVQLLFDALELGYMEISGATTDGGANYTVSETTYLEKVFGLQRYTGVVTGTEYSMKIGGKSGYEGAIEIDDAVYTAEIGNTYDQKGILGKRVYFYIEEEGELQKVVVVGEMENRNTSVKILPEDFIYGNSGLVRYWDENNKEITAKLSSEALIYYNDALCLDITNDDFDVADGDITLVDNNNDKAYDYVFIREYERYVVGNSSYGIITSYYDNWRFNTRENKNYVLFRDGVEVTSDHISQWDEVKVMASKDGNSGIIEASRNTIEGEVTNIKTKDGKTYITVNNVYTGDREFELEDIYITAYEANITGAPRPQKNVSYTFLYNDEGRIYGVSSQSNQKYVYGFLIKTVKSSGLDPTYQCKIFGEFGSMKVYDLADNFKINGTKYTGDTIMTQLSRNDNDGQMVMYRANSAGKLTEILTYTDASLGGTTFGRDDDRFSLDAQASAGNWSERDWAYDLTINGKIYRIPPTTEVPFFYIPADRSDDESYRYYSLQSSASVINTAGAYAVTDRCEVFDTIRYDKQIDFSKLSCLAVYGAPVQLSPVNPYTISSVNSGSGQVGEYCVVRGLEEVVDAYGNPRWQLSYTAVDETKINTAYFADKVYNVDTTSMFGFGDYGVEDLKEGAIIFFNYANPNAALLEIDKFYVAADPALYERLDYVKMHYNRGEYDMPVSHKGFYWAYGTAIYHDDDEMIFETYDDYWITGGGMRYISIRMKTDSVWQYNIKSGEITKSNMAAITRGDRLCLYASGDVYGARTIIRIVEN